MRHSAGVRSCERVMYLEEERGGIFVFLTINCCATKQRWLQFALIKLSSHFHHESELFVKPDAAFFFPTCPSIHLDVS